jgi:HPt (histidine-containing phosphotransfer) domain-containing protein
MQVPNDLKIKYLSRRIQDINKLLLGLENDDFTLAMKLGHQVKGNALTFDFPEMADLGCEIEKAAQVKNKSQVLNLVKKMEQVITEAQQHIFH